MVNQNINLSKDKLTKTRFSYHNAFLGPLNNRNCWSNYQFVQQKALMTPIVKFMPVLVYPAVPNPYMPFPASKFHPSRFHADGSQNGNKKVEIIKQLQDDDELFDPNILYHQKVKERLLKEK